RALLVLADEGQDDAAPDEGLGHPLQIDVSLALGVVTAEAQILPADVADDSAPQGVVEIEDQQLARLPGQPAQRRLEVAGGLGEHLLVKGDLSEIPGLGGEAAAGGVDPA